MVERDDLLNIFRESLCSKFEEEYIDKCVSSVSSFLMYIGENENIYEMGPNVILEYVSYLQDGNEADIVEAGFSVASLKAFFDFLFEKGYSKNNLFEDPKIKDLMSKNC